MLGASGLGWPSLLARLRDLVDLEARARVRGVAAAGGVADAGDVVALARSMAGPS